VLFNSLDQLGSRFPLCAKEAIFIPGIIETLSAESITSIFIGVDEPGQPPEQYGLLSMADLILSFRQHRFDGGDYLGHLDQTLQFTKRLSETDLKEIRNTLGSIITAVVVRVVRFSGGQAAGAGGILELVDTNDVVYKLYQKEGLCFVPFSSLHKQGMLTNDVS
jgi:hypothetical protein